MYSKFPSFLFLTVTFIVLREGYGIKCWDCRSDTDPKCSDPFDNSTFSITDCRQYSLDHFPGVKSTMCRKIRQKISGVWRYIRSCAFLGQPGIHGDERFCLMRTGTYNIFMEYCTCNSKDGCNGSNSHSSSMILILTVMFVIPIALRFV